jgi:hypothetical protein
LVQLLKEAFDYAIHLEKNYPGADKASLPPASDYAWAQVTMTRHKTRTTRTTHGTMRTRLIVAE